MNTLPKTLKRRLIKGRDTSRSVDIKNTAQPDIAVKLIEEAERQKRLAGIDLIFGMWKGRDDVPQDAVAFQKELRSEW